MLKIPPLVKKNMPVDREKDPFEGFTDFDKARMALSYLLDTEGGKKEYWHQRDNHAVTLKEHPFGLDTTMLTTDGRVICNDTFVIADPGWTDGSIQGLLLMLHEELRHFHPHPKMCNKFRLRIIRAETDADIYRPGKYVHAVYFELITAVGTFMCGGCSDCSGEGGSGWQKMEAIFHLVALFYQMSVEEAVIPFAVAPAAIDRLEKAYSNCMHERRQLLNEE